MSSISYAIGKFVGANRVATAVGLALMLGTCMYIDKVAEEQKRTEAERSAREASEQAAKHRAAVAEAEARRRKQLAETCNASSEKIAIATGEMKAGNVQSAFVALQDCREYLTDPQVKALYFKALAAVREQETMEKKRIAAAEKAEKRKHGVEVGMTQQDVLDSSWGKPKRINRTTTARGTREQWVYGLRNYLYFEDGILTTIQN
ncbi:MAG: hypothetical protein ACT4NV_16835 [Rhodoferax sp.]